MAESSPKRVSTPTTALTTTAASYGAAKRYECETNPTVAAKQLPSHTPPPASSSSPTSSSCSLSSVGAVGTHGKGSSALKSNQRRPHSVAPATNRSTRSSKQQKHKQHAESRVVQSGSVKSARRGGFTLNVPLNASFCIAPSPQPPLPPNANNKILHHFSVSSRQTQK